MTSHIGGGIASMLTLSVPFCNKYSDTIKLPALNNKMCENDSTTQHTDLTNHKVIHTSPTLLKQVDQSEQFEPELDNTVVFITAEIHTPNRITSTPNPSRDSTSTEKDNTIPKNLDVRLCKQLKYYCYHSSTSSPSQGKQHWI